MYSQIQTNAGQAEAANMSAENANLQAQVEAVLGTLVKAATVELVKMFESRFQMSALSPTQRAGGKEASELTGSLSTGGTKRSVGVQVETQGIYGMLNFLFLQSSCAGRDSWRLDFISSTSCTAVVHLH